MSIRHIHVLVVTALAIHGFAQCPFTPTVSPDNLVLCPNETSFLATQVYDAYQWYKDGSPISGATDQTLPVSQFADAGSSFTVSATLDGCTEMSASVLVDGWVFLMPYVIHGGDEPLNAGPDLQFCEGDTLTLTLSPGFTENIVWTNNGNPIPGQTAPELIVTGNGSYSASAAPQQCPNAVMGIGVDVSATFIANMRPDIVPMDNGDLCAYPAGGNTQWYLAGVPVGTGTCITPGPIGPYTVFVDYGQACQALSDPFIPTRIPVYTLPQPSLSPVPASMALHVTWPAAAGAGRPWMLADATGRTVLTGVIPGSGQSQMDVRGLAAGNYMLLAPGIPVRPARVVIAR